MKSRFLKSAVNFAWLSLASLASGAVYSTDFESLPYGDITGQDGWAVNATATDSYKPGEIINGFGNPVWGAKSAQIGYSTGLSVPKVYVSRTYPGGGSTPLLGTVGNANATFKSFFLLVDSRSNASIPPSPATDAVRDKFGFRLEDGAGKNLFSFILEPYAQVEFPESDTAFHYMSWSTGTATPVVIFPGPPRLSTEEGKYYELSVTFSAATGNDVAFSAMIGGSSFNGVIPDANTASIATFGAFWETSNAASPGSNYMQFDNLSLIPEPSSALLGLLGASFALVRRRWD